MTTLPDPRSEEGLPEHRAAGDQPGGLVLDIGDDIGAIVVHLADRPVSGELHARPAGQAVGQFHTGVHERPVSGRLVPVAVFPAVRMGDYEVLDADGTPVAAVTVAGGTVTELRLPPLR
jgi:hypothetical protein